jgi:hypothetical protein
MDSEQQEAMPAASDSDSRGESDKLTAAARTARAASRARARAAAKRGLRPRAAPRLAVGGGDSEEARLRRCLAAMEALPAASAWARHRRRVLTRAVELLQLTRDARTAQQAADLAKMLTQLGL